MMGGEQYIDWTDIEDNFATLGAVSSKTFTVPAGKRWIVYGGAAERDQNATFKWEIFNSADKLILGSGLIAAGVSKVSWGAVGTLAGAVTDVTYVKLQFPIPLKAGAYIKYTWGAAQTTPEVTLLVSEHPKG